MKFTINIDCTPQEARAFLGLPDIETFQKSMMEKAQDRMEQQIQDLDAEALMKMGCLTASPGQSNPGKNCKKTSWRNFPRRLRVDLAKMVNNN